MTLTPHSALIVLGDFAGSGSRPLAERTLVEADIDTLDAAIKALAPEVALALPFCPSFRLARFGDLHPDALIQRIPSLHLLTAAREEVSDPSAMMAILNEAGVSLEIQATQEPSTEAAAPTAGAADPGDLLDAMLSDNDRPIATRTAPLSPFDEMLRAIAEEASGGRDFASEDARSEAIDSELTSRLRAVLAHPSFRRIECNWRAIRDITRAGPRRRLWLFDVKDEELAGDGALTIVKSLAAQTQHLDFDDALLFYAHPVAANEAGFAIAETLGALGVALSKDVVAGFDDGASNAEPSGVANWVATLGDPARHRLALALPSVLQRLPYGEDTDELETFSFEEIDGEPAPDDHVFTSAALAVARALARDLEHDERTGVLDPLPLHVYRTGGETKSAGPTRHLLSEGEIRDLATAGVTAIAAVAHQDSARVVGLKTLGGRSLYDGA